MTVSTAAEIASIRARTPSGVVQALRERRPHPGLTASERVFLIAADHPARGALAAGHDRHAMADRHDLLARVAIALGRPKVTGFLGTADMIEDLTLMGALDGKIVLGSMNRGGLAGSVFEIDDRFTGYDARGVAASRLDGGKMLLRIDPGDPATVTTLEKCAEAVDALSEAGLIALIEPFMSSRATGALRNDLTTEAVMRSMAIASGLGRTSAYTWLKLPVVADMERVMSATTLPALLLGGEVSDDPDATLAAWRHALAVPGVRGLVVGRSLLYPPGDDVAAAVDAAAALL